ncbi:MAG TPA: lipase maturation factor family protein [Phycisphaerales bacterium]|nr:lipase maturation factor family protein [Phycisphaerales bacterium]
MDWYSDTFFHTRWLLKTGMAFIYLVAFASAWKQFCPLLGENGLLPVPHFLKSRTFKDCPTLFHIGYTDKRFYVVCGLGLVLSALGLFGFLDSGPLCLSIASWLILWFFYLSLVNVGQRFYGFGWETMLLEAGFLTSFLGSWKVAAPASIIFCFRWMLFRVEVGAGLIKMRGDKCWKDLTCLEYHYETQPLPNPLSWHFHHLPKQFHKLSVAGSHVVQLVIPFGLFCPQPVAGWCAALMLVHQAWLIVCGNYSWLNWLTIVLCLSGMGDSFLGYPRAVVPTSVAFTILTTVITLGVVYLSRDPVRNLLAKRQRMNTSYNAFRLVNSYGAFGSITKVRYEVVLEGTAEHFPAEDSWKEYHLPAKPVRTDRLPPQVAPYHLRLDWQMWFLPFSAQVVGTQVRVFRHEIWFQRLVECLLQGDHPVRKLFSHDPFPNSPPVFIRARFYRYRYTSPAERQETGEWWHREPVGDYLSTCYLKD